MFGIYLGTVDKWGFIWSVTFPYCPVSRVPQAYTLSTTQCTKRERKKEIFFYFSSTTLNSKCRLQTMFCIMPFSTTYFFVDNFLAGFSNALVPLSKPKLLASLQLIKSGFCGNPRTRPRASQ